MGIINRILRRFSLSSAAQSGSDDSDIGVKAFRFSNFDWDAYTAFRPTYPPALFERIFEYHKSHDGAWTSAVDIGSGIGLATKELLPKFDHVTLSDPFEEYVNQARAHFAHVAVDKMSFLVRKAEDLSAADLLPEGKVDLVTSATSLHWTQLDKSVPRIASVLKSGGTFAFWTYGMQVVPAASTSAEVVAAMDQLRGKMLDVYSGLVGPQDENSALATMNARFDNADLDPAVWHNVERVHAHRELKLASNDPRWPTARSRVRPEETVADFEDQGIINMELDFDGVVGWVTTLNPQSFTEEVLAKEFAAIKAALKGGKVKLDFTFVLVLATRR